MTLVCYNKPNRTKKRKYTESDLRRIAGYVHDDGVPVFKIIAVVAVGIGLGFFVCKAASAVRSINTIGKVLKQIAVITVSSATISVAIRYLSGGAIARVPVINRVALVIILGLILIQRVIAAAENMLESVIFLENVVETLDNSCAYVHDVVSKQVESGRGSSVSADDRHLLAL